MMQVFTNVGWKSGTCLRVYESVTYFNTSKSRERWYRFFFKISISVILLPTQNVIQILQNE